MLEAVFWYQQGITARFLFWLRVVAPQDWCNVDANGNDPPSCQCQVLSWWAGGSLRWNVAEVCVDENEV